MLAIAIVYIILSVLGIAILAFTHKRFGSSAGASLRDMRAFDAWDEEVLSGDMEKVRADLMRAVRRGWDESPSKVVFSDGNKKQALSA